MKIPSSLALAFLLLVSGSTYGATLIGSSVSGSISFNGSPYTLGNGIVGAGIELTYQDAANTDTFDFGANTLFIQDVTSSSAASWVATLIDASFAQFSSVSISGDTFGLTSFLNGDTLTVTSPTTIFSAQTRSATLTFHEAASVPDSGATAILLGVGVGVVSLMARGRKLSRQA